MSRPMSFQDFADIVNWITHHNSPFKRDAGVPVVKYIDPTFDMRMNCVFRVELRGFGNSVVFNTVNEDRDLTESLKDRIMTYLTTKREK